MRIYKPNAEIEYDAYVAQKLHMIKNEIRGLRNEYILNVNQEEYINMLVAKHTVSFEIYYDTQRLYYDGEQVKQLEQEEYPGSFDRMITRTYTEYKFHLKYKYSGDIDVLKIQPRCPTYSLSFTLLPIDVDNDELSIHFVVWEKDAQAIKKRIEEIKRGTSQGTWQETAYLPERNSVGAMRLTLSVIYDQTIYEGESIYDKTITNTQLHGGVSDFSGRRQI